MAVFDGWSYEEITTPSVDYYALFERGMGHDEAHRAFRFTDADGRLLALRPDVTSSVARAAATLFADRPRPLRLCYAASVFYRQPRSHAEWRRESTQLGCEYIGPGGRRADMETLAIAAEVLDRLGLRGAYRITLSSVEIFNGAVARFGLDDAGRARMQHLIDLKDAAGLRRFLAAHTASVGESAAFARLMQLSGKGEILGEARRTLDNDRSRAALDALSALWSTIEALGLADSFEIDLGDVSGLDYYTGLVFKIYVAGAGARTGRGGRYDRLTANFGRAEPAVGFVLDLDALTAVLARADVSFVRAANGGAAAPVENDDLAALFLEAAQRRARGERVVVKG